MLNAGTLTVRAYTTNPSHRSAIEQACSDKGYELLVCSRLDSPELEAAYAGTSVLVFDLTGAAFSTDAVIGVLDTLDGDRLPPVLYLLASPADIEIVASAGNIVNQDYTFVPLAADSLASRLEVLMLLGSRRRMTMESAITDRLTGLYNRKYFLRRLEEELYRCARYGYTLGVVMADVDFSRSSGEGLSEEMGTHIIREIAEFFRGRLRKTDIVARFKWSDFGMLLPELERDDLDAVARDLRAKIEGMDIRFNGESMRLKLAVGQLAFPTEGVTTALDVVDALEDCVMQARRNGGIAAYLP